MSQACEKPFRSLNSVCILLFRIFAFWSWKCNNLYYLQEKNRRKERQGDRDRERNLGKSKEEEGKWLFDR
jgi:hypothetical protein